MKFYTQKIVKGEWLKLQDGDNKLRIVSDFEAFGNHYIRETGDAGICIGKEKGCRFCAVGDKPKVNYLCWVIDRKDSKVKLFKFGYSVYEQLVNMAQSDEWGFISEVMPYDITIKKTGSNLSTKYQVMGSPKILPITEEEEKSIKENKSIADVVQSLKDKELKVETKVLTNIQDDQEDIPVIQQDEENIDLSDIPL